MKRKIYIILVFFISLLLFFGYEKRGAYSNFENNFYIKGYISHYENDPVYLDIALHEEINGSFFIKNLHLDESLKDVFTDVVRKQTLRYNFNLQTPGKYKFESFITQINNKIYNIDTSNLTFDILYNENSSSLVNPQPKANEVLELNKAILEDDNYHVLITNTSKKPVHISDIHIGTDLFDKISIAYSNNGIDYSFLDEYLEIKPKEKCFLRVNFLLKDHHGYYILGPYIEFTQEGESFIKILRAEKIIF